MLRFLIDGQLMTCDQYMARYQVSYLRAIHEINNIVNKAEPTLFAARAGALGTPATTAGNIGDAIDERQRMATVRSRSG
jgi:hypothetical protein